MNDARIPLINLSADRADWIPPPGRTALDLTVDYERVPSPHIHAAFARDRPLAAEVLSCAKYRTPISIASNDVEKFLNALEWRRQSISAAVVADYQNDLGEPNGRSVKRAWYQLVGWDRDTAQLVLDETPVEVEY